MCKINMLVSVVVVSYNSSKTIVETLNSIKLQTYNKELIQLIVTDDCSVDNSIELVNGWFKDNESMFASCDILVSDQNCGVPGNINKGLRITRGTWVKLIAGDDLLTPNCIEYFVNYIFINPEVEAVFSLVSSFTSENMTSDGRVFPSPWFHSFFELDVEEQFLTIARGNFIAAPSQFLKTKTIKEVGLFNEKYSLFEDYPMWVNLLNNGVSLRLIPEVLVKYRIGNSLSHSSQRMFNERLMEQKISFYHNDLYPKIKPLLQYKLIKFDKNLECLIEKLIIKLLDNKNTIGNRAIYVILSLFRPVYLARKMRYGAYLIRKMMLCEKFKVGKE